MTRTVPGSFASPLWIVQGRTRKVPRWLGNGNEVRMIGKRVKMRGKADLEFWSRNLVSKVQSRYLGQTMAERWTRNVRQIIQFQCSRAPFVVSLRDLQMGDRCLSKPVKSSNAHRTTSQKVTRFESL